MAVAERRFRAMASDVHLVLVDPAEGAACWAEQRIRMLERRWSRFLATSEISRLNHHSEGTLSVGADTMTLIESMQLGHVATHGCYDPTMLFEICAAGYAESRDDRSRRTVFVDLPVPGRSVHDVVVDRERGTVTKPAGLGLDPGGIGKGLAADLVVSQLLGAGGAAGALVSIGGDLAVAGRPPERHEGCRWLVAVEDPFDQSAEVTRLALNAGGVATSSTRSRRWSHRGLRHHVLDPARRTQASTDITAATVIAPAGWLAEVHATAALLAGAAGVLQYFDRNGLSGIAVLNSGEVIRSSNLVATTPLMEAGT